MLMMLLSLQWNVVLLLLGKATFVMDRGYDDNKMFLKLDALKQDYVIRLKSNRKLFLSQQMGYGHRTQKPEKRKSPYAVVLQRQKP